MFIHDTEVALAGAAALVNTSSGGVEEIPDTAALDRFVITERWSGNRTGDEHELRQVQALRPVLRKFWELDEPGCVDLVNRLLRAERALPQLVKHDDWNWHLHATGPEAPLASRMAVEAAMAMVDVIRAGELSRLRICDGEDCESVVVDLSRNRSKRYCDDGCGNRAHVAAYRARRRTG
ncbi:MAG: CGNR zinc finger domain-containing protein [Candidatus Nanopelagicales bacterium]